jgi:hypothetical protein
VEPPSKEYSTMTHTTEDRMAKQMRECIENCLQCHALCLEVHQQCLRLQGGHTEADHMRTLLDCAQSCMVSADFMLRMSPHHRAYCAVCAEVCRECADSCERTGGEDAVMERCAEACRRCESTCRQMAA